jgi:hypothetical protein
MELIHYIDKHKMVTILFECRHVVERILGWDQQKLSRIKFFICLVIYSHNLQKSNKIIKF